MSSWTNGRAPSGSFIDPVICRLTIPVREVRPSSATLTVTIPLAVTVASELGHPYPDLPVYVFDGETYTGFSGTSDANGQVSFTLPIGDYRFRSDFDTVRFWSNSLNHCTVPGCEEAAVEIPGGFGSTTTTIDYAYDPLYRLTAADYTSGEFFHYAYDAVGNRLSEDTHDEINSYTYDIANRLTSVNGVSYTWNDNGNLLNDGASTYSYDHANRLVGVTQGSDSFNFDYNGLGDRLQQTVNGDPTKYTLDINRGLTQVIEDGTNSYLYGIARIGEKQADGWQYHITDALGSVRQLSGQPQLVAMFKGYKPFGDILAESGSKSSIFQYAGQQRDETELTYLRARYLNSSIGKFVSRDVWSGLLRKPQTLNRWSYVENNPINLVDPSGHFPDYCQAMPTAETYGHCVLSAFKLRPVDDFVANVKGASGCWEGAIAYRGPGYEEGVYFGAAGGPGATWGRDVVYDFAAMERDEFKTFAITVGDFPGLEGGIYVGLSYGFSSAESVTFDYAGDYLYGDFGLQIGFPTIEPPIPVGVSYSISPFITTAKNIGGLNYYVGVGAAAPILMTPTSELGYGSATSRGRLTRYSSEEGQVYLSRLVSDISSGESSPWLVSPREFRVPFRAAAVMLAVKWARIFEEIHYEN